MDTVLQDRLRGVAVGAAIGDALGMPLEFGPAIPADRLVRTMQAGRLPAGAFTDDTEMALALADSLLERSPLDADSLARHFVAWYRAGPSDVGIQTSDVLGRIARRALAGGRRRRPAHQARFRRQRFRDALLARRAGALGRSGLAAGRQPAAEPGDPSAPRVRRGQRVGQRDDLPPGAWR